MGAGREGRPSSRPRREVRVGLLDNLALDRLTPSRLWAEMDPQTRRQAASCLYRSDWDDAAGRIEADAAIASAMRFRAEAVRRLPLDMENRGGGVTFF